MDFHLSLIAARQVLLPVVGTVVSMLKTSAETGEPRLAATTRRLAQVGSQTAQTDASRPTLLGLVAEPVERLEIGPDDRKSRRSCRLASYRLPFVLDVENPPW